jgi:prepilin-type N-terminal cleavage/methylation domain-containing protein
MNQTPRAQDGFTLIELSIVLVIIGLIVGGVLVGQDLIRAAEVRATIAQIEKYNTAVNTFHEKYGYLPGDIKDPDASSFGFKPRGPYAGSGNGDGILTGINGSGDAECASPPAAGCGNRQAAGEAVMFWVDLSTAGLIEGGFSTADPVIPPGSDISGTSLGLYLPPAKLGRGNYFYVYDGMLFNGGWNNSGTNYFGLSGVTTIAASSGLGRISSNPALSVVESYNIDQKIDDGLPQSGNVLAQYMNLNTYWIDGAGSWAPPTTTATEGSSTTCYDNGNVAGPQKYSVEINNGAGVNCALSFQFQ